MPENYNRELSGAIERLYEVFQPYTPPSHPSFCAHCVSDAEDAVLHNVPLRKLSAKQLSRYSLKAISTWGTVEQFKYLLPRLFELIVNERLGYNPEILFNKPRYGDLSTWPDLEKQALAEFCAALWRAALAHHPLPDFLPEFGDIDECLCSVAQIIEDLRPLLQLWEEETTPATLHLGDFVSANAAYLEKGKLANAFWRERPDQEKQVVDWFSTFDFALVLDLAELGTLPREVAAEVVQAVIRRSRTK